MSTAEPRPDFADLPPTWILGDAGPVDPGPAGEDPGRRALPAAPKPGPAGTSPQETDARPVPALPAPAAPALPAAPSPAPPTAPAARQAAPAPDGPAPAAPAVPAGPRLRLPRRRRPLAAHVLTTHAGHLPAAARLDALLARREPLDATGAVAAYRGELAGLLTERAPLAAPHVHQLLRQAGVAGHLRALEGQPVARGATAAVFRGEWVDGTPVAVKVLDPQAWTDLAPGLAALLQQAGTLARYLDGADLRPQLARAWAGAGHALDFPGAAARQQAMRTAFAAPAGGPVPDLRVPAVRLSAPGVLVSDWADGLPLDRAVAGLAAPARARAAATVLAFAVAAVTTTGMAHADLHPGHVLLTADGGVSVLDYAVCAPAPVRLPDAAAALVRAARAGDVELARRARRDLAPAGGPGRAGEALALARDLVAALDGPARPAGQLLARVGGVDRRGLRAPEPLAAVLEAWRDALALAARLGEPVDPWPALATLPGTGPVSAGC